MRSVAIARCLPSSLPVLLLITATPGGAVADEPNVRIVGRGGDSAAALQLPADKLVFAPDAGRPGVSHARLVGDAKQPGLYLTIVKMAKGTSTPPHMHPDGRFTTVLQGSVLYGIGDTIDPSSAKVFPAGSVYYTPPNTPHYLVSVSPELIYEEVGIGPSGSTPASAKK